MDHINAVLVTPKKAKIVYYAYKPKMGYVDAGRMHCVVCTSSLHNTKRMSQDSSSSNVRLAGYLASLVGFHRKKARWQKRYYVLHSATESSLPRLDWYENEDRFTSKKDSSSVYYCEQIREVAPCQVDKRHAFQLKMVHSDSPFTFACCSAAERESWLTALDDVMDTTETKAPLEPQPVYDNRTESDLAPDQIQVEEESRSKKNSCYQSLATEGMSSTEQKIYQPLIGSILGGFDVEVIETEASKRCKLSGLYKLNLTSMGFLLRDADDDSLHILMWPYRYIRRYGYYTESFTFEAGRRCESGEGLFAFKTQLGPHIYAVVQNAVRDSEHT